MTICIDTDDILLVKNDIGSQIAATITRDDTNSPVDLSGSTVFLKVSKFGSKELIFTVTASLGNEQQQLSGIAIFTFSESNLANPAGRYQAEIEMRFDSGKIETVFELINITLRNDID